MATREVIALNETTPQLLAPQAGDTYLMPRELSIALGTITTDLKILDLSATWNAAGVTFSGIKLNVTDTASAAGSLLMDLQVGGVSKVNITKAGDVNAQTLRLYNTFTDASNYERGFMRFVSNVLEIGPEAAGTGVVRPLRLYFGAASTDLCLVAGGNALNVTRVDQGDLNSVNAAGFYASGGGVSSVAIIRGTGLAIGSTNLVKWSSTTAYDGAADLGFARSAAGLAEVNNGTAGTFRDLKVRQHYVDQTITAGGTTGNQTINKAAGTVNFAAAATAITVTNSLVTTSSQVFCVLRTNDATARLANVVPAAGSFTINLTAAATAETSCGFVVIN